MVNDMHTKRIDFDIKPENQRVLYTFSAMAEKSEFIRTITLPYNTLFTESQNPCQLILSKNTHDSLCNLVQISNIRAGRSRPNPLWQIVFSDLQAALACENLLVKQIGIKPVKPEFKHGSWASDFIHTYKEEYIIRIDGAAKANIDKLSLYFSTASTYDQLIEIEEKCARLLNAFGLQVLNNSPGSSSQKESMVIFNDYLLSNWKKIEKTDAIARENRNSLWQSIWSGDAEKNFQNLYKNFQLKEKAEQEITRIKCIALVPATTTEKIQQQLLKSQEEFIKKQEEEKQQIQLQMQALQTQNQQLLATVNHQPVFTIVPPYFPDYNTTLSYTAQFGTCLPGDPRTTNNEPQQLSDFSTHKFG